MTNPTKRRPHADTVEDVLDLRAAGESTDQIVKRLERRPESIGRALHRAGRTDLARPFWALARRLRRAAA